MPVTPASRRAVREGKHLDFKASFDPTCDGDWCEIIKDIVAMANSGGGSIHIGIQDDGTPSGFDVSSLLGLDLAKVADKVSKYTGESFDLLEILAGKCNGASSAEIRITASQYPIVFANPGTYSIPGGKQKTAFGRGTVYVRHGAKSEPASSVDLRRFIDSFINKARRSWLSGIRKVVSLAPGAESVVVPKQQIPGIAGIQKVRIVDDPDAPVVGRLDPDAAYPLRLKDVAVEVTSQLVGQVKVRPYDVLKIVEDHRIRDNPEFYYKSRFASPQYTHAFVDRVVKYYESSQRWVDSGGPVPPTAENSDW